MRATTWPSVVPLVNFFGAQNVIKLRPRQEQAVADLRAAYRSGKRAPILVAPTGFGKSATASVLIQHALGRGKRVWFLAHLREILEATSAKLVAEGIPHGLIMAKQHGFEGVIRELPVQVCSVQTLVRRLDRYTPPDLLIIDECHLAVAETYQAIVRWAPEAWLLGLTATPQRLDGRGLNELFDWIVPTCGTAELIAEGLLAPVRYYAPQTVDLSAIPLRAGDYAQEALAAAMDKPTITGSAVAEWMKVAHSRPTIVFCVSIAHAEHTAEAFRQAGVRAVAVSGDSDPVERDQALADLRAGRVDVVCNCALFVAGLDVPSVACIVLLAPTNSLTKFLQSVGRGLRTHPGKADCIILDHAGNIGRHGSPLDARLWSLDGAIKKTSQSKQEVPVKACPACFSVVMAQASHCQCGHVFTVKPRTIQEVEGELREVELKAERQAADERAKELARRMNRQAQGRAQTEAELVEFARSKGYSRPHFWARQVMLGRIKRRA